MCMHAYVCTCTCVYVRARACIAVQEESHVKEIYDETLWKWLAISKIMLYYVKNIIGNTSSARVNFPKLRFAIAVFPLFLFLFFKSQEMAVHP